MTNENSKKLDFSSLTEKLNSKFKSQTTSLEETAKKAKIASDNIDPSNLQQTEITFIHTEPKVIHEHTQTVVNNYNFNNLAYIALGIATAGALTIGGLYLAGYFTASTTAVALNPLQVKAMTDSLLKATDLSATNQARFSTLLYDSLVQRAKDTPIDSPTLEKFIIDSLKTVSSYMADHLGEKIQDLKFVRDLGINEAAGEIASDLIHRFGSPGKPNVFYPMFKASLAAGLVFTKIKAAFGYEIPKDFNEEENFLQEESIFEHPDQYSFNKSDFLLGNITVNALEDHLSN